MSRIEDLEAFIAVVECGSLTSAGRRQGRSLQAVSRSMAVLERDIGVELVHRTTRRCVPSEAGLAFYKRIVGAVDEIGEAKTEANTKRAKPSGILRIGAPVLFGPSFLTPVIAEYIDMHPNVEVELELSDAFVDLASDELDLVLRIGHLPDSGLQSKRLGSLRRVVFGAPAYFKRHGRPAHPTDLRQHRCIVRTVDPAPGRWAFQVNGKPRTVTVSGSFRSNTMSSIYSAVTEGVGIGYSPLWQIKSLVDKRRVELVLENFEPAPVPIHLLWKENKLPPAKVRSFIDLVSGRLKTVLKAL